MYKNIYSSSIYENEKFKIIKVIIRGRMNK